MSNHSPPRLTRAVQTLAPSATLAVNELARRLQLEGRAVYKLGFGQSPFPVPRHVVAELKRNAHQKDYLPVSGLPELRSAVSEYHLRANGLTYSPEQVLIGPGSKELLFILQVVFDGILYLPSPCWLSYAPQGKITRKRIRWFETNGSTNWLPTAGHLKEIGRAGDGSSQLVILNYPSNPAGTTYHSDVLRELADVAREYGIVILSDEIYGELDHEGNHTSIARFYPEGTIVSAGLSKWCGAGGWRLGTFTFPRELEGLQKAMTSVASETFSATSAPIQYAAVTAYQGGEGVDTYLTSIRKILKSLGSAAFKILRDAGVHVTAPQGGFYLFPDFSPFKTALASRGVRTDLDLCERLITDVGVMVLPGSAFGRSRNELTSRLAYVDFDGGKALNAVMRNESTPVDDRFLKRHCERTLEGIRAICSWLNG